MHDGPNPKTGDRSAGDVGSSGEVEAHHGLETRQLMDAVGRSLFGEVVADPVRIGRFVVVRRIGEGAMGLVYLAYDPDLDRRVAIKVLRKRYAEVASERMLREGRALARLSHPNVVTVFEVGTVFEQVFVAMEYIEGGTLRDWTQQHPCRTSADVAAVLSKFAQAGAGLAKAHALGVVHRDFKPDNVLLDSEGGVRVADFGLAAAVTDNAQASSQDVSSQDVSSQEASSQEASWPQESAQHARLTRTGEVVGTPVYMAPEQMVASPADARSDQYAFCVSLYEALYGERPYQASTVHELQQATLFGDPPQPPTGVVPTWIAAVILRGLSREGDDRHPSMVALLAALANDPSRRRRRVLRATVGTGLVTAVVIAAYVTGQATQTATPEGAVKLGPCAGVEHGQQELWNPDTHTRVSNGLAAVAQPWTASNAELTVAKLNDYAAAWGQGRRDNCEATRVRAEQSEAMFDRREACYRRAAAWMATLAEAFASADARIARNSLDATAALPSLEVCKSIDLLSELAPIPAEAQSSVNELRTTMAQLDAKLTLGQGKDVVPQIENLKAAALALAFTPLHAEVHQLSAEVLADRGKYAAATTAYANAFTASLSSRHDEVLAAAAVGSFDMWGPMLRDSEQAQTWQTHASAAVARLPVNNRHRWQLTSLEGELACRNRELERCLALNQLAVTQLEASTDRDNPIHQVKLRGRYAVALAIAGETERALAMDLRVLSEFEQAFGPEHPTTASARANAGVQLQIQGRLTQARQLLEHAIEGLSSSYPKGHDTLVTALAGAALVAMKLGNHELAAQYGARAHEMAVTVFGPQHPLVASILRIRGRNAYAARRFSQAIELANAAIALRKDSGATPAADDLLLLGRAQLQLGRASALTVLEQALALEEGTEPGSVWSAPYHERLARLYVLRREALRAQHHIDAALAARAQQPQPDPGADLVHATAALVTDARNNPDAAREHWTRSITCANAQEPPGVLSIARAKLGLARLALREGDAEQAGKLAREGLIVVGERAGNGAMLRGQLHTLLAHLPAQSADTDMHLAAAELAFEPLEADDIEKNTTVPAARNRR